MSGNDLENNIEIENAYQRALKIDPANAVAYKELTTFYIQNKQFDKALATYKRAAPISLECAMIYSDFMESFRSATQIEIKTFMREILTIALNLTFEQKILPEQVSAFYRNLEPIFSLYGIHEDIVPVYRKIIEATPTDWWAYMQLASALEQRGNDDEALAMYREAVELASTDWKPTDLNWVAYTQLAAALERRGNDDEALAIYRKAAEVAPTNSYAYTALAFALERRGKNDEAITQYRKAIELNPQDVTTKANVAELALIAGVYDNALTFSKEVLQEKAVDIDNKFAMRFLIVAALFFQQKPSEAAVELNTLFDEYSALSKEYPRSWRYDTKEMIQNTGKLREGEKTLLLALIDMLESSKAEGDKKLQALKARLPELLPQ